ncbi:hypothetical protein B0T18DRAFT_425351 [Schizothecium vesticola]|uniref:Uncharacterized protein n=1 Tax=Schizothecium vesticola TaxID=314040 RepID=A0AA40KDE8_9PEZI|nr:hypothetical protein B0T18DRAFT_425351 [Schizothecium vesticola]
MLTYSYMDKAQARSACDLMVLFYICDEYTDIEDEHGAAKIAGIVMDALRDHTGGCLPSFALIELGLGFPDVLYRHGKLERLREITNRSDIYSYNIERARGHVLHNIMTCEMYEKNMDVQEVGRHLNDGHNGMLAEFLGLRDEVDGMSRAEHGDEVARQHFEGDRHFGKMGPEIQKTREVLMLPRMDVDEAKAGLPVGVGGDGDMIREMLESTGVASMQINAVKAQHA